MECASGAAATALVTRTEYSQHLQHTALTTSWLPAQQLGAPVLEFQGADYRTLQQQLPLYQALLIHAQAQLTALVQQAQLEALVQACLLRERNAVNAHHFLSAPGGPRAFPPHLSNKSSTPRSTALVTQSFIGGPGSVLLVENLDPILPASSHADRQCCSAVQLSCDHLFQLFGVYGDVVCVQVTPGGTRASTNSSPVRSTEHGGSSCGDEPGFSPRTARTTRLPPPASAVSSVLTSLKLGSGIVGNATAEAGPSTLSPFTASLPLAVALVQFMTPEQASLAERHLNGVRMLGSHSSPMQISVASCDRIRSLRVERPDRRTRGECIGAANDRITALTSSQGSPAGCGHTFQSMLRSYYRYDGHRFKYQSSRNARHIAAPCAVLHLSGLGGDTTSSEVIDFFVVTLARVVGTDVARTAVQYVELCTSGLGGRALLELATVEQAILAVMFGHEALFRGKRMRVTFSHVTLLREPSSVIEVPAPAPRSVPIQSEEQLAHSIMPTAASTHTEDVPSLSTKPFVPTPTPEPAECATANSSDSATAVAKCVAGSHPTGHVTELLPVRRPPLLRWRAIT